MKNLYKKGKARIITVIVILIAVVIGIYFYAIPKPVIAPVGAPSSTGEQKVVSSSSVSADIDIANFAFNPDSVTIKSGTTINWTDKDSFPHTVTSDTGLFDSGQLAPASGKFSYTFSEKGTFAYHCSIHPNMKGTIIVQ